MKGSGCPKKKDERENERLINKYGEKTGWKEIIMCHWREGQKEGSCLFKAPFIIVVSEEAEGSCGYKHTQILAGTLVCRREWFPVQLCISIKTCSAASGTSKTHKMMLNLPMFWLKKSRNMKRTARPKWPTSQSSLSWLNYEWTSR